MKRVAMLKAVSGGLMLLAAMAGPSSAQSPSPQPSGDNEVQFTGILMSTSDDGNDYMRKMRERLQDPQQRAALREEHRAMIAESNVDMAEVLGLDAATSAKLVDLLTDQQMAQLEQFHLRPFSAMERSEIANHLQSHAERQNKDVDALRAVLGQEKLERYQAFQRTLAERRVVNEFDEHLKSSDKLSRAQKEQLVQLYLGRQEELFMRDHYSAARSRPTLEAVMSEMPSQEEMQRRSQMITIEANQNIWRRTPEFDRKLREQAATVLTASQLAALEQLQAQKLKVLQRSIEQMRVQAGLTPDIPPEVEAHAPTPAQVTREVRVRIKIAVNQAKPTAFTEVVSSGTPIAFETDGLLVQATPTVFDNNTYALRVEYFEQGATGKRSIGHMGNVGTLSPTRPETEAWMGGSSGSVVVGSKAYAIELSAVVEPT